MGELYSKAIRRSPIAIYEEAVGEERFLRFRRAQERRPLAPDELEALRQAEANQSLVKMKALAEQIASAWTSSNSGVELVAE